MMAFELLSLLPPFLKAKYRGRMYENLRPCIYLNGSRVNVCYTDGRRELLLLERITDQNELESMVKQLATELKEVECYAATKLFIYK